MKITLNRRVRLEKFSVVLDVGKQEKREEFIAYLLLTKDRNGYLYPEDVCEKLLNNADISIGRRVLELCKSFFLIDDEGHITEAGEKSIKSGSIYVPERGVYDIIVTRDPLYPDILIDLRDSKQANLFQESKSISFNPAQRKSSYTNLTDSPKYLKFIVNKEIVLPTSKEKVTIFEFEPKCIKQSTKREELFLEIQFDMFSKPLARFSKLFNEKKHLDENINFHDMWKNILGKERDDWRNVNGQYKQVYDFHSLKENEIRTWMKSETYFDIDLQSMGNFRTVGVENIPIFPKSELDANKWSKFLLWDEINDYLTEPELKRKWETIKEKFYPFNLKNVSINSLLKNLEEENKLFEEKFWYLQAPIDLNI